MWPHSDHSQGNENLGMGQEQGYTYIGFVFKPFSSPVLNFLF